MNSSSQKPGTYHAPPVEALQGVVERLTYHSEESGYTVARLKAPRTNELITITGNFANIQAGQTLQLQGTWKDHPKFGAQFQVTQYRETKPATITGIQKYLGSGLIKGVGPVTAKRIVAHFGVETLDIIEHQIERLIEVPGIAQKRVKLIQAAWVTQKAIKEVMLFLQSHGVSTTYAVKIYKQYGDAAIETVSHNPYQLATDVYGIGFVTADAIARNLGIAPASEFRYRSGILHVLGEASEDGHCFLPANELVERVVKRLEIADHRPDPERVTGLIEQMVVDGELVKTEAPIAELKQYGYYAPPFFGAEKKLAERLQQLLKQPLEVDLPRVQRWIERFVEKTGTPLSEQQRHAVEMAASRRVLILTGGPGTGKTFCTRTIVALWKAMGKSIALASPTGRASQRLSEMTRQEAKTVHRLLEFDPKTMKFKRDEENPIPAQAIVVDEASMLDLFLANSLVKAIGLDAQLLFVGDTDQLPSVGPGSVLQDLIASGQVPVVRLTQVFRQAQASQIVSNAHRINQGQFPQLEPVSHAPRSDCLWLGAPEPAHGVQAIQELVTDFIPQLGIDSARDVQVLCPMTRGEVGTRNLNTVLQCLINPPSPTKAEIARGGMTLRVGDRIIQKVNDYDREVFNGDLGSITAIDGEEQEVIVQFAERSVTYDYADLNEITLAWAVTIHKSQGSEYPVVILPIYMQHYLMLSRNLIYTGLTRAKKLAILVGPQKAIGLAVRQIKDQHRYTLLEHRLQMT
ncbi:ATP-dependent RecD-like DNA helicase (plasmid) [Kovacikia minuta CCNUW1]|uniref:SF1B family DNA helicase RecD2 n=1 Tax=Kovacikia minuta TaxID=2931930 RepID=UPI001CCBA1F5|nr:ATP-dependent RecD-like DNA helicase [Kovacikia minuta]UBF30344.1 ATP-dependent RecD-like DNA helicase [Kovacikia minuta CCNUW1]